MYIFVGLDRKWIGMRYIHIRFANQKAYGFGLDLDKHSRDPLSDLTNQTRFRQKPDPLTSLFIRAAKCTFAELCRYTCYTCPSTFKWLIISGKIQGIAYSHMWHLFNTSVVWLHLEAPSLIIRTRPLLYRFPLLNYRPIHAVKIIRAIVKDWYVYLLQIQVLCWWNSD